MNKKETDPNGIEQHEAGSKLDDGKVRLGLVLGAFAEALIEVGKVGTYGANKYSDNGWVSVPDGIARYKDAALRHYLADASGEILDKETGLSHLSHFCWNSLAILSLIVREEGANEADNLEG